MYLMKLIVKKKSLLRRENVSISSASLFVMHGTLLFSPMSFTSLLSDVAENS